MPEFRKDPIIGRWVIISTERGKRPSEFVVPTQKSEAGFCPFCAGNEESTPPEILAYRDGGVTNGTGWKVRVVPNKFPALTTTGEINREGDGLYDKMNGVGAHEVIIETPDHDQSPSTIGEDHFELVLLSYRDRIKALKEDRRIKYVLAFRNHGEAAGATLEHPHSQIIALPIVPKRVCEELEGSLNYYKYKERCVFCDIIRQELTEKTRVITENDDFIAISPYAPKSPFESWILPKVHASSFENTPDKHFKSLARIFTDVLRRIDKVLKRPPYNYILHTAPLADTHMGHYHWHFEIMPQLTRIAGFEWGSGFYINPTPPEEAARLLRKAAP